MHTQWESLANEHILGIAPYEPGKPIEELERELGIHDADQARVEREPAAAVGPRAEGDASPRCAHLNRYPDGSGFYLRQALAKKHGVTPDQVVLGNGSNELIELLVRTFLRPGDEAVVPHPSFVVYPMIVQAAGGIRVDGDAQGPPARPRRDGARDHADDEDRLRREPEQPDRDHRDRRRGRALHGARARAHDRRLRRGVHRVRAGPRLPGHARLPSSRGARWSSCARSRRRRASPGCGWATAWPIADAIALMNRIRQPFNVNSLAQVAALAALDDDAHVLECVRMIEAGRALPLRRVQEHSGSSTCPRAPTSSWSTSAAAPPTSTRSSSTRA